MDFKVAVRKPSRIDQCEQIKEFQRTKGIAPRVGPEFPGLGEASIPRAERRLMRDVDLGVR